MIISKESIKEILNRPFPLLDDLKSRWFLILFCGSFASFFIIYFNPFNIKELRYDAAWGNFLTIWTAGIWGSLSLFVTQIVVRRLLKFDSFIFRQFLLWSIFDFLIICLVAFILFGEHNNPLLNEILIVVRYTLSLALLPYFLACLIIAVVKLTVSSNRSAAQPQLKHLIIYEENGKIGLSLEAHNLLFLKSENNYTSISYLENGNRLKKLIRKKLSQLEQDLQETTIIRVHRSYMINTELIESISRKGSSLQVVLKHVPEQIFTVTESYKKVFEEATMSI